MTVLSPFPIEKPPKNYTSIDISEMRQQFERRLDALFTRENMQMNLFSKFKFLYQNSLIMTNITLQHPEMKKLVKSGDNYDLIILDIFLTDALLGLSTVFNCPVIAVSANGPHTWVNRFLGSSRIASYLPHMNTDLNAPMNLGRRLENAIFYFIENILLQIFHIPQQEQLFNQVFTNSWKTFKEIRENSVAVSLVNPHFSYSFPKPFLPNAIEVAGMQINEDELKPLPEDIKEFIESSLHGIIYFSLGNINPSMMDNAKKQELVRVLSSLQYKTIWRLDDNSLQVDTNKIMIRKWLPQYGILGHSNTKLFITHAGLHSYTEAIHFAKNMIAVPIFGDQVQNAKIIARAKQGIHLSYSNFTGKSLTWAIEEISSNSM